MNANAEDTTMKTRKVLRMMPAVALAVGLGMVATAPQPVHAHCQIPCGIYNDEARFTLLEEHITTIEKSMNQIIELSKEPGEHANQLTRWVLNKEDHADQLAEIVTKYFLQQRIKPADADDEEYVTKLRLCHGLLVGAMKAKQTTDLQHVAALRDTLGQFRAVYFGEKAEASAGGSASK